MSTFHITLKKDRSEEKKIFKTSIFRENVDFSGKHSCFHFDTSMTSMLAIISMSMFRNIEVLLSMSHHYCEVVPTNTTSQAKYRGAIDKARARPTFRISNPMKFFSKFTPQMNIEFRISYTNEYSSTPFNSTLYIRIENESTLKIDIS